MITYLQFDLPTYRDASHLKIDMVIMIFGTQFVLYFTTQQYLINLNI